ncbi:MAG: tetratricopeptide repeat protein [Waddliaceae bacterium]
MASLFTLPVNNFNSITRHSSDPVFGELHQQNGSLHSTTTNISSLLDYSVQGNRLYEQDGSIRLAEKSIGHIIGEHILSPTVEKVNAMGKSIYCFAQRSLRHLESSLSSLIHFQILPTAGAQRTQNNFNEEDQAAFYQITQRQDGKIVSEAPDEDALVEKKAFSDEHLGTLESLEKTGDDLFTLGRYKEALKQFNEVLAIKREVLGNEHPRTAKTLLNIGRCFFKFGRYKESLRHFEKALPILRKAQGNEDLNVADCLSKIGECWFVLEDFEKAFEHAEKALEIRKKVLGNEHIYVASSLYNTGHCLHNLGRTKEALERFEEELAITRKVRGNEQLETADCLKNIGSYLNLLGRYEEACERYEEVFAIMEKALGIEHPDVKESLSNVVGCLLKVKERPKVSHKLKRYIKMF